MVKIDYSKLSKINDSYEGLTAKEIKMYIPSFSSTRKWTDSIYGKVYNPDYAPNYKRKNVNGHVLLKDQFRDLCEAYPDFTIKIRREYGPDRPGGPDVEFPPSLVAYPKGKDNPVGESIGSVWNQELKSSGWHSLEEEDFSDFGNPQLQSGEVLYESLSKLDNSDKLLKKALKDKSMIELDLELPNNLKVLANDKEAFVYSTDFDDLEEFEDLEPDGWKFVEQSNQDDSNKYFWNLYSI